MTRENQTPISPCFRAACLTALLIMTPGTEASAQGCTDDSAAGRQGNGGIVGAVEDLIPEESAGSGDCYPESAPPPRKSVMDLLDEAGPEAEANADAEATADADAPPETPETAYGDIEAQIEEYAERDVELQQDPETGVWSVVQHLPDGEEFRSKLSHVLTQIGAEIVTEIGPDGEARASIRWPDGVVTSLRVGPEGETEFSELSPDGTLENLAVLPGGGFTHSTALPDGTVVTEHRDTEGELLELVTTSPDGTVKTETPSGNVRVVQNDGETTTITQTDPAGNRLTASYDAEGNLIERETEIINPKEPGRNYYEEALGGTDWENVPENVKRRYAHRERDIAFELEERARQHAQKLRDERQDREFEARSLASAEERDAKLAEIAAEQETADRQAAEWHARNRRREEVAGLREEAIELQRRFDAAVAAGDDAAAERIQAEQDALEDRAIDVLLPTEDEQKEIDRRLALRQQLQTEIGALARAKAEAEVADDLALQDAKEAVTDTTEIVFAGSEMQQETAPTTRQALRQLSEARATIDEIDRRLAAGDLSYEEAEMLRDMRGLARQREDGASKLLSDNARITAAGYAIDVASTATGAAVVRGVVGAAARGLARAVGKEATKVATSFGQQALAKVQGSAVGKFLATDVGTPIVEKLGAGARRAVGDRAVDAAARAAALAASEVKVPAKVREMLKRGAPAEDAATRAAGEAASVNLPQGLSQAERRALDEVAGDRLHPSSAHTLPPRHDPQLPPERQFQTPEAAERFRDADGLLEAEREHLAKLDRRIDDLENEFVIGDEAELARETELTALRHEREGVLGEGKHFRERLDFRRRQGEAGEFSIPADSPVAGRPQKHINAGRVPRRKMVTGDDNYLNGIMSTSRFEAAQNHIVAEGVNSRVEEILTTGRLPLDFNGLPSVVRLVEIAPNRYAIQNGHHGLVAGEIASRLSGRPLLPSDAVGTGLKPIIPPERLEIIPLKNDEPPNFDVRSWAAVGVR